MTRQCIKTNISTNLSAIARAPSDTFQAKHRNPSSIQWITLLLLSLLMPFAYAEKTGETPANATATHPAFQENYDSFLYLGDHVFALEIANTPDKKRRGMMHRPSMQDTQAMIFVFDSPQRVIFWMKNTLIPLDMLFFDSAGILREIKHNVPPCQQASCPTYPSKHNDIQYVVEIKAGQAKARNITVGQRFYVCGFM